MTIKQIRRMIKYKDWGTTRRFVSLFYRLHLFATACTHMLRPVELTPGPDWPILVVQRKVSAPGSALYDLVSISR